MERIKLDEFLQYHFLSNVRLSPNAKKAAFVVSRANEAKDGYDAGIWTVDLETRQCHQLTAGKDERSFVWLDDQTILFTSKRDSKKEDVDSFYTDCFQISLTGGEARKVMTLPAPVEALEKLDDDTWLLCVDYDGSLPEERSPFRKPGTGMVAGYLNEWLDRENSYVIGDRRTDMELARRMGIRGIFLGGESVEGLPVALRTNSWEEVASFVMRGSRRSHPASSPTSRTASHPRAPSVPPPPRFVRAGARRPGSGRAPHHRGHGHRVGGLFRGSTGKPERHRALWLLPADGRKSGGSVARFWRTGMVGMECPLPTGVCGGFPHGHGEAFLRLVLPACRM